MQKEVVSRILGSVLGAAVVIGAMAAFGPEIKALHERGVPQFSVSVNVTPQDRDTLN